MKYFFTILFLIFYFTSFAQTIKSDSIPLKNIFSLEIGYPMPASGGTFNRIYLGTFSSKLGYERMVKQLSFGGNFGFKYFSLNQKVLNKTGSITFVSPGITFGYHIRILKSFSIYTNLKMGYDFITYNGADSIGNSRPSFHDGGLFLSPMISLNYFFNRNIGLGICSSYELIFQRFGNNALEEESTTRVFDFGIKLIYKR